MDNVIEKIYLGHILQSNGQNEKKITDKINKTVESVNKIISAINERAY